MKLRWTTVGLLSLVALGSIEGCRRRLPPPPAGARVAAPWTQWVWYVRQAEVVPAIGDMHPTPGHRYVIVRLTYRNDASSAQRFGNYDLQLIDAQNRRYEPSNDAENALSQHERGHDMMSELGALLALTVTPQQPGYQRDIPSVFEVPDAIASGPLRLVVREDTPGAPGREVMHALSLGTRAAIPSRPGVRTVDPPPNEVRMPANAPAVCQSMVGCCNAVRLRRHDRIHFELYCSGIHTWNETGDELEERCVDGLRSLRESITPDGGTAPVECPAPTLAALPIPQSAELQCHQLLECCNGLRERTITTWRASCQRGVAAANRAAAGESDCLAELNAITTGFTPAIDGPLPAACRVPAAVDGEE